jgi:hypothetical protein
MGTIRKQQQNAIVSHAPIRSFASGGSATSLARFSRLFIAFTG